MVFSGFASEWESAPDHRTEYEKDICYIHADRSMSCFGK